jgi:hypothetical protein
MSDTDDGVKAGDDGAGVTASVADKGGKAVVDELGVEQVKNRMLVEQVVGLEDVVLKRDQEDFAAVITDVSRGYWQEQLLNNRAAAVIVLADLVNTRAGVADAPRPMHNRAVSRPVVPALGGGAAAGGETDERAARIRNRAHEISRADRVAFPMAFRRAELEFGAL